MHNGYADVEAVIGVATDLQTYENISPKEARTLVNNDEANLLDVRNQSEVQVSLPELAQHVMLGKLLRHLDNMNNEKKLIALCETGWVGCNEVKNN